MPEVGITTTHAAFHRVVPLLSAVVEYEIPSRDLSALKAPKGDGTFYAVQFFDRVNFEMGLVHEKKMLCHISPMIFFAGELVNIDVALKELKKSGRNELRAALRLSDVAQTVRVRDIYVPFDKESVYIPLFT